MFPTRAMIFAVFIFFSVALTPLVFKVPDGDRIQNANVRWPAVEMAKSEDRIFDKQIDAEQTDITGSAPIPTPGAAGSIDIDQTLAIEFPVGAYEPHKVAGVIKRHPRRAKIATNQLRSLSNNFQASAEANFNHYKPMPPPNFTISGY